MNKERRQHYVFAHIATRQLAFESPWNVLAFASPQGQSRLVDFWEDIGKTLESHGERGGMLSQGLAARPTRAASFPCCIIELPTPQEMAEAYFVAIVVKTTEIPKDFSQKPDIQYLALENGFNFSTNQPRTVLTEWTREGTHVNFGDGPSVDLELFRQAVEIKIAQAGSGRVKSSEK